MNDDTFDTWTGAPSPEGSSPAQPPRSHGLVRRRVAGAAVVGGLAVGGLLGGYVISHAATAVAAPSASPNPAGPGNGGHGGMCGPGGAHGLQSEDLSAVAGVIGISGSDLQTALGKGQTIAAVAKAHNVDVSKVIGAWVASENKEIDDRVSSGQITKAQGDQMKAMTRQRITDEVNGTVPAMRGGPGGFAGPRGGARPDGGGATQQGDPGSV